MSASDSIGRSDGSCAPALSRPRRSGEHPQPVTTVARPFASHAPLCSPRRLLARQNPIRLENERLAIGGGSPSLEESEFRRIARLLIGLLRRAGESRSTYKPRDVRDYLVGVRQAAKSLPAEDVFEERDELGGGSPLVTHLEPVRCGFRAIVAHVRMVPRRRLVEDRHPKEVPRHETSVTGRGPHGPWRDPKPRVEIAERPELDGTRAVPRGPGYRRIHGETTKLVSEASVRMRALVHGTERGNGARIGSAEVFRPDGIGDRCRDRRLIHDLSPDHPEVKRVA